ncbi:phage major capsid protein [Ancylobacter lacus]|uniref:phage major capsid protein n=1 Tax=Ancylobacter lacus TaxID=2579970 RepID=UPI001BCE2B23|nr:hypothetical protein [Ancylobacter lacus]MBS7539754.1 hypothetical protein [Ancylobacter lacus]
MPRSRQVLGTFREAEPVAGESFAGAGAVLEAQEGNRFRVRIIRAGVSGNGNYYPDAALREGAPLFEGARVIVKPDAEHLALRGKDPRAVLGRISGVNFVPGASPDTGTLEATFEALNPADPMVVNLREAISRGMSNLFGLSIDARGTYQTVNGVRRVGRFTKVNSVDLIVEPGADGRVLDVLEAEPSAVPPTTQDETMPRWLLLKLLKTHRPAYLAGKDEAQLTEAQLVEALGEALNEAAPPASPPVAPPAGLTREDLAQVLAVVEARHGAREQVSRATLPEAARTRVLELLEARGDYSPATVTAAISAEQAYIAPLMQAGRVQGLGAVSRIETGETRADKVRAMLEAFFDPTHKDHRHARSIKECYVAITGDTRVTGQLANCDEGLMREALDSTSLDVVLGDSITRRMLADYRAQSQFDVWRLLTGAPVPISDFRVQQRTRFGGYGNLPIVAERGAYQPVTSPDDEKAQYSVAKRGGTESISLEMIKNDDVGVIQRIPQRLSRAAKRTLAQFVLDFLRTNPVIYDTKTLFHVDHNNLFTAALDAGSYAAARLAMLKQAEAGSNERLSIAPKYLWVSADGEQVAADLFRRDTNLDETFVQSLKPTIVPVFYWTDANDWCVSADPADIPTVEIGFLDGNEEPELFVQDSPSVGSMFTNDVLTWKLRHIYGGNVMDYRGLAKSVVA